MTLAGDRRALKMLVLTFVDNDAVIVHRGTVASTTRMRTAAACYMTVQFSQGTSLHTPACRSTRRGKANLCTKESTTGAFASPKAYSSVLAFSYPSRLVYCHLIISRAAKRYAFEASPNGSKLMKAALRATAVTFVCGWKAAASHT